MKLWKEHAHGGGMTANRRLLLRTCGLMIAVFCRQLKMINWKVRKIKPVECIYTPREQYRGRKLMAGHKELTGRRIELVALWLMDEDDPYPGEWALASPDSYRVFGRSWIASGDVIQIRKFLFTVARHTHAARPCAMHL